MIEYALLTTKDLSTAIYSTAADLSILIMDHKLPAALIAFGLLFVIFWVMKK